MLVTTAHGISLFAAAKRLEAKFKPPDKADEALIKLRELVGSHEARDERFMLWLAESLVEARLLAYVKEETELAHYALNGYADEVEKCRGNLARIEQEWQISATLLAYFKGVYIENSAKGLAEFFKDRYPKKTAKADKK